MFPRAAYSEVLVRTIIAGTRTITSRQLIRKAMNACPWQITTVLNGCCWGVDSIAADIAKRACISVEPYPAYWDRYLPWERYKAAHDRNQRMVDNAEALLLIWNGKSRGSADVLRRAKRAGLLIHEVVRD